MSDSSRRVLTLTYGFAGSALVVLVMLFATSFWLFELNRQASEDLLSAREKRGALFRLMLTLQDAETGQRGLLVTGDPAYLEPYRSALPRVQERLQMVHAAFGSKGDELARIDALIDEKLQELARTIALFVGGKIGEALDLVKTDRGREIMDEIRSRIDQLVASTDADLGASARTQVEIASRTRLFTSFSALLILGAAVGAVVTILKYTRDLVAARTELEQSNLQLEERVKHRTSDLQSANDEIQRFAYIVSHDLRSPLVNIMGFTSELEASVSDLKALAADPALVALAAGQDSKRAIESDIPESIAFIRRSTTKMDALIKAILQLSREGQRVLSAERIDLSELIESITASVQHRLSDVDGRIVLQRPLAAIQSDRLALEQIFGNLIDNAIKYRRPGVPLLIDISVQSATSAQVAIAVKDNGRGIAPTDLQRIFDLFRRAGTQDQPGDGIGLAHARALIRRLGGDITVSSKLNAGTEFLVTLSRQV